MAIELTSAVRVGMLNPRHVYLIMGFNMSKFDQGNLGSALLVQLT